MSGKGVVVIKLGSNALLRDRSHLDLGMLDAMAGQLRRAVDEGWRPVLVSSGAVASGRAYLDLNDRVALPERQALAAIGQADLMHRWQVALSGFGLVGAQLLLTADDFHGRQRYLNITATFRALFSYGVIPVVNENDTVSVDELTFGDNDRLSALVASQLDARILLLLTDIDGVYDADPRHHSDARLLRRIERVDQNLIARAGPPGQLGRGGMRSKLEAAALAAHAGVAVAIARAAEPDVVPRILAGEELGTAVAPQHSDTVSPNRRRWLALARAVKGGVRVDEGAMRALRERGKSLLIAGIRAVDGRFERGDTIAVRDEQGREFARGLAGLSSAELSRVAGQRSDAAARELGYALPKAAIHRDNLLLLP